jgi:hypothetical protein
LDSEDLVRRRGAFKGVQPLVRSHYTFPSRLPGPGRLGSTGPSRRCRGCSHQRPALPGAGCPQLQRPAATGRRWVSHSTRSSTPRGALRARSIPGPTRTGRPTTNTASRPIERSAACPACGCFRMPPSRTVAPYPPPQTHPAARDSHSARAASTPLSYRLPTASRTSTARSASTSRPAATSLTNKPPQS